MLFAPLFASILLLTASAPIQEPALSAQGLADEIDRSVRWLRQSQDLEKGAYGDGSAGDTASALLAFARCPRAYRRADGPFIARALEHLAGLQRADGAFPSGEIQREGVDSNTALVVACFEELGETPEGGVHARAVAYLGPRSEAFLSYYRRGTFPSVEAAATAARQLLAERSPDGSWPDGFLTPGPSVARTARAILELSDAYRALRQAEKAAPTSSDAAQAHSLPSIAPADRARVETALQRGAAFLTASTKNGRFGALGREDAGITAMVLGALLAAQPFTDPSEAERTVTEAGLAWLRSLQKEDGSIHEGQLANYVTSAAILALSRSGNPKDAGPIARARAFLVELQADEGEGYDPSHHYYGGVGYGGDERPDLSNLQMALEALAATGSAAGDDTFRKALRFLERSQNRSESNDIALEAEGDVVTSGNDGGGVYAPGDSKAGFVTLSDGTRVPRSYGSMTYALLKGYLFAGLSKEDPRVEAAWKWLRANYTLDVNPGFEALGDPNAPYQGLFYYFATMARALALYGEERVEDAAGIGHDWRAELAGRLIAMQRPDGSWVNENSARWWEGNPVLATAYAMLTLIDTLERGADDAADE